MFWAVFLLFCMSVSIDTFYSFVVYCFFFFLQRFLACVSRHRALDVLCVAAPS